METQLVDFGCILNNTEVVHQVKMTNTSPLRVNYKWKFLLEKDNVVCKADYLEKNQNSFLNDNLNNTERKINNTNEFLNEGTATNNEQVKISKETVKNNENNDLKLPGTKLEELLVKPSDLDIPNIEEIFDISPIYGNLNPGETQTLLITYYGHKEVKAYVRALCEVINGPEYELVLKGEASVLNYELSNSQIDLGCIVSILFTINSKCTKFVYFEFYK